MLIVDDPYLPSPHEVNHDPCDEDPHEDGQRLAIRFSTYVRPPDDFIILEGTMVLAAIVREQQRELHSWIGDMATSLY